MACWLLLPLAILATVAPVVLPEIYPLFGQRSVSRVLKNNCVDKTRWNVTVSPDPESHLKGLPYVQFHRGEPECEPIDVQADTTGNPIYIFEFNAPLLICGIRQDAYPNNGTYRVTIVLPFRTDGIEVVEDHILLIECASADVYWHNHSIGAINPAFTDYNPNKTDDTGVTPPTIRVTVLRGDAGVRAGDQAFLGETLTMRVQVSDDGGVYTKVKVQELWATFADNPTAAIKLDILSDGCSLESVTTEAGIPVFENFATIGSEAVIQADFRVFRFAGNHLVYFWLTITSCAYTDDVTCILCEKRRRKRQVAEESARYSHAFSFSQHMGPGEIRLVPTRWQQGPLRNPISADLPHNYSLKRVRRAKIETGKQRGILVPNNKDVEEGNPLSGTTNFQLTVANPAKLPQAVVRFQDETQPPQPATNPPVREPDPDICLTVVQIIIFSVISVTAIFAVVCVACCLFCKLRDAHRKERYRYINFTTFLTYTTGNSSASLQAGPTSSAGVNVAPSIPIQGFSHRPVQPYPLK